MAEQINYNQLYGALTPLEQEQYAGYKIARNLVPSERDTQDEAFPDYKEILDAEAAANKTKPNMWNPMNWIFSPAESAMATDEERAAIERGSADIERRSGVPPGGYELPARFRDPQASYMENRPPYGYDRNREGPIGATGRRPDDGGHIESQEPFEHPYGMIGRRYSPEYLQQDATNKGFLTYAPEHNPILQRALINRNRQNLYGNEGIGAVDIQENITEQAPLDTSRFQNMYWGPSSEEDEEVVSEGITGPNKWQKFLSKITRQPYRPAMGGVTMGSGRTYSPAQLNKMNALGGWYSEPSRAVRRTEKRVADMLARRAQGKSYSEKNLKELSGGKYDFGAGKQGSYTAATTPAPAGVTTSSGMHGGRHYRIGGRVGYNTGGRVGILSVF